MQYLFMTIFAAAVVAVGQFTKFLVLQNIPLHGHVDFIPGLLAVIAAVVFYMFTREMWLLRWGVGAVLGIYLLIKIIKRKSIF